MIPLSLCQKSITGHLRSFHINTKEITSEAELVKLRGGLFKQNVSDLTICPNHRVKLGNNWKCGTLCNVGYCESARKKSLQNSSVSKQHSLFIWHTENRLVPIGSGMFDLEGEIIRIISQTIIKKTCPCNIFLKL